MKQKYGQNNFEIKLGADNQLSNSFIDHIEDYIPMHPDYRKARCKSAFIKKRGNTSSVSRNY